MRPSHIQLVATVLLALAILHTFSCGLIRRWVGNRNFFHLLGEVELVFAFWAGVLLAIIALLEGRTEAYGYVNSLRFTEPLFVLAIMMVAATRPVIELAKQLISHVAGMVPGKPESAIFLSSIVIGPLLGSLITEPAAMTVTALILRDRYFQQSVSSRFKYLTLAVLFVNVSIGGVLTPYAAPPVLMVARTWGWDLQHMFFHFGWKAALAIFVNGLLVMTALRTELRNIKPNMKGNETRAIPIWLTLIHLVTLISIVCTAHHPDIFIGVLFLFLGITKITEKYQDRIKIRESIMVSLFLAGLVVLGGLQSWWLHSILSNLNAFDLFLGATALTSVTDNAALTYLAAQVTGLSEISKYAVVAGAVAGGGLTVIANAPNPAGYSILQGTFGPEGIQPIKLLKYALLPTAVAMVCLWFLP